ncbi:MAG: dockerin type I repeat-containing protein, partial [Phycisphaerae bacterium]
YFTMGRYKLILDGGAGGVQDIAGNALDGDGELDVFPSGDGVPGGDWAFELNVLVGDVSQGDGVVDALDRDYVCQRYGGVLGSAVTGWNYDPLADVNGDGVINVIDRAIVRLHYGDVLPPPVPQLAAEFEGSASVLAAAPALSVQSAVAGQATVIPDPVEPQSPSADASLASRLDVLSVCRGQLFPRRLRSPLAG